jgi:HEPN domain-containing protein
MTKDEKIAYWKDIANYDLETANTMLTGGRYLYVGFMCHQAVEKMLKAYYTKIKEETPPFIHNLKILANACDVYYELSDGQKDLIDELIPLNIEARYPTYKEKLLKTFGKEKCGRILIQTAELCRTIEKKL